MKVKTKFESKYLKCIKIKRCSYFALKVITLIDLVIVTSRSNHSLTKKQNIKHSMSHKSSINNRQNEGPLHSQNYNTIAKIEARIFFHKFDNIFFNLNLIQDDKCFDTNTKIIKTNHTLNAKS